MSRSGDVDLAFGAEIYPFRLAIGEWRKVQEITDAGPPELLARLAPAFEALRAGVAAADIVGSGLLGRWRVDDVRAPILYGLIGGGMAPVEAAKLVREWVDHRPMLEPLAVAYQVVLASITGPADERAAGEPRGEAGPVPSPTASSASASPASMPPAAPSASRRAKSTN